LIVGTTCLATGGTARATAALIHRGSGRARFVGVAVLMELSFPEGPPETSPTLEVRSLLVA